MSINTTIKSIQDIMRKDVGVDGDAQRISQLVWMMFLKIYDDLEVQRELMEDNYKSVMPKKYRWSQWAGDEEGITGDELMNFVNNELFPTLKELPLSAKNPRTRILRSVFEDAYNYMKSGTLMRQVINKINAIDFNRKDDRHLFGDIYEKILKDLQSAGNAGEYYTPRAVTQFMTEMVDPQLGEKVLDPACGTGGFLASIIDHVETNYVKTTKDRTKLQSMITGYDKKPLPHMLCITNMILHGIEVPTNVLRDNALARPLRDYKPSDRVDVVLTNPPFGGVEEDGIENNFPAPVRTRETADLFLVLITNILKDGGRGAVVLPDGTLFGEGVKTKIKQQFLEGCNLHTIVRLPKSVFAPYTSIKTNLLFFTKGEPTKEIWYYEHPYPEGMKAYSKTKPMSIKEFAAEKAWWKKRKESDRAWKVSIKEIQDANYNLDFKNPNTVEEDLGDPEELLKKYKDLMKAVSKSRDELKAELVSALER